VANQMFPASSAWEAVVRTPAKVRWVISGNFMLRHFCPSQRAAHELAPHRITPSLSDVIQDTLDS
jgi:hypothetical protein